LLTIRSPILPWQKIHGIQDADVYDLGSSMKYRVTGINHDKGARMTLELHAESKADAERKARNSGMDVQHIQDMSGEDPADHPRHTHRGEDDGEGARLWIKLVIILVVVGVAAYFAWPRIRWLMSMMQR
jgi:hypothetical protein